MKVTKIGEFGYEQAVLGFSLSYNSTEERTKVILPRYAFAKPGENKFLESIFLWFDITAPRFWWQEADTYRLSTKQSESTMHTITKKAVTQEDFEYSISDNSLIEINELISMYHSISSSFKKKFFAQIKNRLPEGFLQRRVWVFNYKVLQNIYIQRHDHRLEQWQIFLKSVLEQIEHPEFIVKGQVDE